MESSNPQHYQPLSYALHQPVGASGTISPSHTYLQKPGRQEEEEDDDDDEDVVEQQLNRDQDAHPSVPSSPIGKSASVPDKREPIIHQYEPEKRRPGRPRGSKNRQRDSQPPPKPVTYQTPAPPPPVDPQNQQYYEFQWRVLNLCAEFYSAAEELVKGANPLVIAQCYAAPQNKVDPLFILNEAKRVCDSLIATPARLIATPPPPMYPIVPSFYQPAGPPPPPPSQHVSTSSAPPTVISQPQSFVVSMGAHGQYPMYPSPYQAAPYYHYPGYAHPPHPSAYLPPSVPAPPPPPPPAPPRQPSATPAPSSSTPAPQPSTISNVAGNQGAWTDVETDRLKSLVEEGKSNANGGELNWEWVVTQFGNDRTQHQILIKATQLGLKDSSTRPAPVRGVKRRREEDTATPPLPPATASPSAANTSPTEGPPTPMTSPAAQKSSHLHPPPSKSTPTPNLPWPMPTVAANTASPVERSTYYRPRTTGESSKPIMGPTHGPTQHQFMYHPNSNGVPPSSSKLK